MAQHNMKLNPTPFANIKSGKKDIELRLYDEKRREIAPNDIIIFTNNETQETLPATVVGLCRFSDFGNLVSVVGAKRCGWDKSYPIEKYNADMEKYYSKEDIEKYGALGIVVKVID